MDDPLVAGEVEKWFLADDSQISFARVLFGDAQVDGLRRLIKDDMARQGREIWDDPSRKQRFGAELATRWIEGLAEWNERKLNELSAVVRERSVRFTLN